MDDAQHIRSCQHCAKEETAAHSTAETLTMDENAHWYTCTDCSGRIQEEEHSFDQACDSPCGICGFLRENGHRYSIDWETDSEQHWHPCEVCGTPSTESSHMYDNACDSICNTCGYDRQVNHTFSTDLLSDATGHWRVCVLCGIAAEIQPHEPGAAATEEHPQLCTACGCELAPKLVHSHDYKPVVNNAISHSMICDCGAHLEDQQHTWNIAALQCSICGFDPKESWPTLILLCAVPVTALLFGLILLIHSLKRRSR